MSPRDRDWPASDRNIARSSLIRALLIALERQLEQDAEDDCTRRQAS